MRQLDEMDRAIVDRLQYDGRMPFTEIAAEVGLSEGAVRRRVKRMTEDGVLQIVGIVEPQLLEWNAAGMIGVSVHPGQIEAAAHQIAQFPEVTYLFMASGGFDLFVEAYCRDREHFVAFLNGTLQKVPGVERTETFMILKMYKLSYRWGDAEPPRIGAQSQGSQPAGGQRNRGARAQVPGVQVAGEQGRR
jgi:Lrp/AsnC family transcriptional regulator for asnA, asnC and gidA